MTEKATMAQPAHVAMETTVNSPDLRADQDDGGRHGPPADLAHHAESYWKALSGRSERAALDVVLAALDEGAPLERVLLDVIAAGQRRIGTEWAANRISVAQEHAATAISERVVAALSLHRPRPANAVARGRITVACADGEWHALPARLLAEILAARGWQVDYLGAHVPGPHLIAHLHQTGPDAVALSSLLSARLPAVHAVITACQAAGVPVLAGGAAFGPDGRYARLLGADAWAPDALAASEVLAGPIPAPRGPHQAVDDLPHLADQEYTMIERLRPKLVADAMQQLAKRVPAMASYTPQQLHHTAEDLAHIAEYVSCAVYVNDPDLFTSFVRWTAEILAARNVPLRALTSGLDVLKDQLHDFPRATGMIDAALFDLADPADFAQSTDPADPAGREQ
ncbi:MAG TPA: cobalamin-dependent protein [Actinocrinis sp.]|nr:cobalamin-dependent protein [Actinocrinis sp.]